MRIGVPKEVKIHEYRVGLVPAGVRELVDRGHEVIVESNAGLDIGIDDVTYQIAGAEIANSPADVFDWADLIIKVKEPQSAELGLINKDQVIFTNLHLAADAELTNGLIDSGCIATVSYTHLTLPTSDLV